MQQRGQNKYPGWGELIGMVHGVPAYSNTGFKWDPAKNDQYQSYLSKQESKLARDVYLGFKYQKNPNYHDRYQCVEYARRFLVYNYHVAFGDVHCAYHIWPLNKVEDLTKQAGQIEFYSFPQGGQEPPKAGDVIIYHQSDKQRFGHVAIVGKISLRQDHQDVVQASTNDKILVGTVEIAEQNYEDKGWVCNDYSRKVNIYAQNQGYVLTNLQHGYFLLMIISKNQGLRIITGGIRMRKYSAGNGLGEK